MPRLRFRLIAAIYVIIAIYLLPPRLLFFQFQTIVFFIVAFIFSPCFARRHLIADISLSSLPLACRRYAIDLPPRLAG